MGVEQAIERRDGCSRGREGGKEGGREGGRGAVPVRRLVA